MAQTIAERIAAAPARTVRREAGLQGFVAGSAALGITLSGATQLRMTSLPAGPSELILVSWVLFVAVLLLRGVRFTAGRVFFGIVGYWLLALLLLGLGALVAIHARKVSVYAVHDATAFLYLSVLTSLLALGLWGHGLEGYHLRLARMVFLFSAGAAALLFAAATVTDSLGPIGLWFGGIRFRGWAANPNQMALAMVAMPFLGWWLLRMSPGRVGKMACALGIAVCIIAGIVTQSDALRVAWVASLGAISALLFYRVTMRGRSRWLHISHVAIPAVVVIVGVAQGDAVVGYVTRVAEKTYAAGDQGDIRITSWLHGFEAIGLSPLVGFGPGAYSGLSAPFQDFEAHNSLIDWGMSTGICGIILHIVLWGWCLRQALRSDSVAFLGIMVATVVFAAFGYSLRHPNYWIVLLLVLTLSERRAELQSRQAFAPALGGGSYRLAPARQTLRSGSPKPTHKE
jgi:hypothetical protein